MIRPEAPENRQAAKSAKLAKESRACALRVRGELGGELIIELKSVEQLAAVHGAQVISYLQAFEQPLGLLITFNVALLKNAIRRVVYSPR